MLCQSSGFCHVQWGRFPTKGLVQIRTMLSQSFVLHPLHISSLLQSLVASVNLSMEEDSRILPVGWTPECPRKERSRDFTDLEENRFPNIVSPVSGLLPEIRLSPKTLADLEAQTMWIYWGSFCPVNPLSSALASLPTALHPAFLGCSSCPLSLQGIDVGLQKRSKNSWFLNFQEIGDTLREEGHHIGTAKFFTMGKQCIFLWKRM